MAHSHERLKINQMEVMRLAMRSREIQLLSEGGSLARFDVRPEPDVQSRMRGSRSMP